MYMSAADALLVRDHAEPVGDLAVARGVGDRELVRHGGWQPDGQQPGAAGLGGLRRDAAQPAQLVTEFAAAADHVGGGLDLAAGQLELQLHPALGRVTGDRLVDGDRFARRGIGEEEFLLDADRGMSGHGLGYRSGPSECFHDGPDRG